MSDLIERIEAASGPCLVLDRDIALSAYAGAKAVALCDARISVWNGNGRTQLTVKPYTASAYAAMTLVPEGHDWLLVDHRATLGTPFAQVKSGDDRVADWNGRGKTPALALCAAALKARAHRSDCLARYGEDIFGDGE